MISEIVQLDFDAGPVLVWPSVSLCMIVKNEEAHLADCLTSVEDFATEIIIVDTGSTDRTVQIARSFGAKVKYFRWVNDFAAARNESIKEAQGDWVFWMDADDRLSPETVTRLKQAVICGQADAYICRVVSQGQGPNQSSASVDHMRLFRNGLGLQFEQPIHEQIAPMAKRLGLTIAHTDITIDHLGYAADSETLKAKARRNRAVILQCLDQQPDNLYWRFHLGVNLYTLDDWAGAAENFEAVLNQPPGNLSAEQLYEALALMIAAYNNLAIPEKVEEALERALKLFSTRQHLWVLASKFYLSQNRAEKAISLLEYAKRLPTETDGMAWPQGTLETLLSRAYLQQAQSWYKQRNPSQMAEVLVRAIDIAPLAERNQAYKLMAVAMQQLGREQDAVRCWQLAQNES
ncbi:MAG: glycosyltransferase [Anaerolineae bacterium]|nr:glycosyltransferase [Anaerolineae bacterium]